MWLFNCRLSFPQSESLLCVGAVCVVQRPIGTAFHNFGFIWASRRTWSEWTNDIFWHTIFPGGACMTSGCYWTFLKLIFLENYLYAYISLCVCRLPVHLRKAEEGIKASWSWSCRWLWSNLHEFWELNMGSFARTSSPLYHTAISSVPVV